MTITAYKDDSFGLTTTFYNDKEESFFVKSDNPLAWIKHILPVKVNYVFDGKDTHKTCIGARFRVVEMRKLTTNDKVLIRPIFELI